MGRYRMLLVVILAAGVAGSACSSAAEKRRDRRIKDITQRLTPAALKSRGKLEGEPRVMRVRVYADDAHRAQSPFWIRRFEQQLDPVNQFLIPEFGVKLEVVEYAKWEGDWGGDSLVDAVAQLATTARDDDVHLVIGLVSALSIATTSVDALGTAQLLGHHMVLRGYDDVAEHKAIRNIDLLSDSTKEWLLTARRQHKQSAVLLHEWGHLLGAIHVKPRVERLMSPGYHKDETGFSEPNANLIRAVLPVKLAPPGKRDKAAEARALKAFLASAGPWDGWVPAEYNRLGSMVDVLARGGGAEPEKPSVPGGKSGIPPEAAQIFRRVQALAQTGNVDAALEELKGLLDTYPAHVEFRLATCRLWLAKEGPGPTATDECRRLGQLDAGELRGELMLAAQHVEKHQLAEAAAVVRTVADRIPEMPPGKRQAAWGTLLGFYRGINAVTWAETLAKRAPRSEATEEALVWADQTRPRYGLPKNASRFGIPPEREGEYIGMVRTVLDLVYRKQYAEAKKLAQRGLRKYRDAPGLLGAVCDLELRARRHGVARTLCQRALRGFPQASWPRYLLGIIELHYRRNQAGIDHLKRAIATDPDLKHAYHALDKAYARRKDQAARQQLGKEYRDRFGRPMP